MFSGAETTYKSPVFAFDPPEPVSKLGILRILDFSYFNKSGFIVHAKSSMQASLSISTMTVSICSGIAKTKTFGRTLFPKQKIIKKD